MGNARSGAKSPAKRVENLAACSSQVENVNSIWVSVWLLLYSSAILFNASIESGSLPAPKPTKTVILTGPFEAGAPPQAANRRDAIVSTAHRLNSFLFIFSSE